MTGLSKSARIAFLGLGKMGLPMVMRLVGAGFDVVGFDLVAAAREALVGSGGRVAESVAEAAKGSNILVTMLPDGRSVANALLGQDDILSGLADGSIVIDMSSSAPLGTRELADHLADRGISLLDAPVSGGVKRAIDGSLAIMVGGPSQAITKVRPLLEAMGKSIFETGPVGSGHAMKALNNYVSAAGLLAACEALRVGQQFGLDPVTMTEVLNASTGRNNSTENKLIPFVIPKNYASGFSMALMVKDLGTADDLARELGVPAPFSAACRTLWSDALNELGPGADHTAIDSVIPRIVSR